MKRCVIIGGADIRDAAFVRRYFREDDFFIYCDSGLAHRAQLCAVPNLIVGDFDSHPVPTLPVETIVLPREKDETDTVYAAEEALRRGFEEFLLAGVIGGRIDHTIGNLSILLRLDSLGKRALAVDDHSEMEIVSRIPAYIDDSFAYFSLLSLDGAASDICVRNAKYPLQGAEIDCEYPYGISNEVLPGETAEVRIGKGRALLVRVRG